MYDFTAVIAPLPMSTAPPPPLTTISTAVESKYSLSLNLTSIGFGYAISIAFSFLFLFFTILLASYICCLSVASRRRRQAENPNNNHSNESSIHLPRIIYVDEVDENDGQNVVVGLHQAVIDSYPTFVFTKRNGRFADDTVCSICLCEYGESEMLRMLPDCRHCFHAMCVDSWLKLNASCPVCRNSPLPSPLSTPLQEVVPLSQYSDGRRVP